jgi:hypothetical protein
MGILIISLLCNDSQYGRIFVEADVVISIEDKLFFQQTHSSVKEDIESMLELHNPLVRKSQSFGKIVMGCSDVAEVKINGEGNLEEFSFLDLREILINRQYDKLPSCHTQLIWVPLSLADRIKIEKVKRVAKRTKSLNKKAYKEKFGERNGSCQLQRKDTQTRRKSLFNKKNNKNKKHQHPILKVKRRKEFKLISQDFSKFSKKTKNFGKQFTRKAREERRRKKKKDLEKSEESVKFVKEIPKKIPLKLKSRFRINNSTKISQRTKLTKSQEIPRKFQRSAILDFRERQRSTTPKKKIKRKSVSKSDGKFRLVQIPVTKYKESRTRERLRPLMNRKKIQKTQSFFLKKKKSGKKDSGQKDKKISRFSFKKSRLKKERNSYSLASKALD